MWRKTPQTTIVRTLLAKKGHATNHELAIAARKNIPTMSDTTVHRITARLVKAGLASYAPSFSNTRVLDNNFKKHDHFYCQSCRQLVDIYVNKQTISQIESQLPGKMVRDSVLIAGVCQRCIALPHP